MFNIPYFLKNVIKNKLEIQFKNFSDNIIKAIVDCLINSDNKDKYVSIISNIEKESKELIVKIIADIFEALDQQYFESKNRKLLYESNKANVTRTITTIFGEVYFKRHYYKSKMDGSHHFVLDEALNLPKYDRYDPIVKALAINTYSKTNMSLAGKITGEQLTNLSNLSTNECIKTIPRQSIYNWIKDWNIPKLKYEQKSTPNILYVMSDENFIGCQDKENDIMIKSFVVFEGVKHVSKDRNELVNKTVINVVSPKPWIEFTDILYDIYDSQKVEKIYLLSDGANWIKSGISELKVEPEMEVKHLLCEFHYKQAINHITTDPEEREMLKSSFKDNTKKEFIKSIDEVIKNNPNRKETIEKKKKYILNNYNAVKDMLNSDIGSSMESHISHYVANQFGSRPKGYSSKRITDYINISNFYNNNFNIYNLYINSYNNDEVITINESEINYSMFERKVESNIPIINNGHNTPTYKAIKGTAHNVNI